MDTFTPTEVKIANYLIENKELARTMTSYDLSEKLGIGQSNIIRFSQKLGYKGFRDLQLDILINTEEEYKEINEDDSTEITNNKIVQQYVNIASLNQCGKVYPLSIAEGIQSGDIYVNDGADVETVFFWHYFF